MGDNGVVLLYQSKKKNAKVRWKKGGNFFRNLSVLAQKNDLQKWKEDSSEVMMDKEVDIIETKISCIKRTFGDIYSIK